MKPTIKNSVLSTLFLMCTMIGFAQKINTSDTSNQNSFPEKCLGIWEGDMKIYGNGKLRTSVNVQFTVAKTDTPGRYVWKTSYNSPTRPMVKDYRLVIDDLNKGQYLIDEGNGLQLKSYQANNKLYSHFKVEDNFLTSTTELVNGKLIIEVTSGKPINEYQGIQNYAVSTVQRMELKKIN